jgi:hypothetical protein
MKESVTQDALIVPRILISEHFVLFKLIGHIKFTY